MSPDGVCCRFNAWVFRVRGRVDDRARPAVAVGPRAAIPAILLMLATSAQLRHAPSAMNWPTVNLSVGGVIGILIGAWLIVVDQGLVRKSISITVFLCDCDADGLALPGRYRGLG